MDVKFFDIEEKINYIIKEVGSGISFKNDVFHKKYTVGKRFEICDYKTGNIRIFFNDDRTGQSNNFILLKIESDLPEKYYIDMIKNFFILIGSCNEYHIKELILPVNIKPAKK